MYAQISSHVDPRSSGSGVTAGDATAVRAVLGGSCQRYVLASEVMPGQNVGEGKRVAVLCSTIRHAARTIAIARVDFEFLPTRV